MEDVSQPFARATKPLARGRLRFSASRAIATAVPNHLIHTVILPLEKDWCRGLESKKRRSKLWFSAPAEALRAILVPSSIKHRHGNFAGIRFTRRSGSRPLVSGISACIRIAIDRSGKIKKQTSRTPLKSSRYRRRQGSCLRTLQIYLRESEKPLSR